MENSLSDQLAQLSGEAAAIGMQVHVLKACHCFFEDGSTAGDQFSGQTDGFLLAFQAAIEKIGALSGKLDATLNKLSVDLRN